MYKIFHFYQSGTKPVIRLILYVIFHLQKLKLRIFNNDFKVRLQKETYLGYVWNYLGQGQNCKLKNITDSG